jgi:hypothetical protein
MSAMAARMDISQLAFLVIVATVNLGLAVAVYLRNKSSVSNRAFTAAVVAIVCWVSFAYLSDQTFFGAHALLLNRLTLASALLMGMLLLRFALVFPAREAKLPGLWVVYLWCGALLAAATLASPLVVAGTRVRAGGTDVVAGPGFAFFIAWACVGVVGCVFALVKKYRLSQGRQRDQLKFLALGMAGFVVSCMFFGLILPAVTGSYEVA